MSGRSATESRLCGFSARSGGIARACGMRISLDQSTSVSFKVPLAALTDGGTFCAPRDGRMRCDGGLIRQFAPSQSSIPVMPPLNGLLEGTWDSRFATLFALRKSVRRSPNKFVRSYVAAVLERDLLTLPAS